MNLPSRMLADDLIHEVEKLAPSSSRIVAGLNLPGSHIQSSKQGRSPMSLVIMAETTQRPSAQNLQVSLSSLQRLDMRFLIHRQDQGVVGRIQIKANNVRRLGGKLRIGAHTPAAPSLQLNATAPQDPPDVHGRNVAQGLSHQGAVPDGITRRWGLIQLLEDPTLHPGVIASWCPATGSITQPGQSVARKA